jgi:hypothetical protein
MKRKLSLIGMIVVAVLLVASMAVSLACLVPSVKTTGGGWFINEGCVSEGRVTFGLNVIPTGEGDEVKGQFQLVDHSDKPPTRIHGTFDELRWVSMFGMSTEFEGTFSINGDGPYDFRVEFTDKGEPGVDPGDEIKVKIFGWECRGSDYKGTLGGGNIQIHVPEDF